MVMTMFEVPPKIRRLLGPAPMLSTEDPNQFEDLLKCFAQDFQPKTALEWFRVWHLSVANWKINRLTGFDIQILEAARRQKVEEEERARTKQAEEEQKGAS